VCYTACVQVHDGHDTLLLLMAGSLRRLALVLEHAHGVHGVLAGGGCTGASSLCGGLLPQAWRAPVASSCTSSCAWGTRGMAGFSRPEDGDLPQV
jgi:hypothetical protein